MLLIPNAANLNNEKIGPDSLLHPTKTFENLIIEEGKFELKRNSEGTQTIVDAHGKTRELSSIRLPMSAIPQWVRQGKVYKSWKPIVRVIDNDVIVTGVMNPGFQTFEVQVAVNAWTDDKGMVHAIFDGAYEGMVAENSANDVSLGYAPVVSAITVPIFIDGAGEFYIVMMPEVRSVIRSQSSGKWGLHPEIPTKGAETRKWNTNRLHTKDSVVCYGVPYGWAEKSKSGAQSALEELNQELGLRAEDFTFHPNPIGELCGDRAWEASTSLVYVATIKSPDALNRTKQSLGDHEMIGKPKLVRIDRADPGLDAWIKAALWDVAMHYSLISPKPLR